MTVQYGRFQDCAGVILYTAEAATKVALDAIQILGTCQSIDSVLPVLNGTMMILNCCRWKWLHQRLRHWSVAARREAIRDRSRNERSAQTRHRSCPQCGVQQVVPMSETTFAIFFFVII